MTDRNILKFAFIFSLIGIFALYLISQSIEIPDSSISDIGKDSFVKIKGIVDSVYETEKVAFVKVIQPEQIEVVLFKENEFLDIQEGDYIEVSGTSEEYEGETQIVGNVVKKIR